MSERITERKKFLEESGNQENIQLDHPLPESDDDEDYIDTGAAILNFYCTLVDLLGRCAPDSSVISLVSCIYYCYQNHVNNDLLPTIKKKDLESIDRRFIMY